MRPVAIYGAGGLGREVLMLIRQVNLAAPTWEPVGFFDDAIPALQSIHGLPILGGMQSLNGWKGQLYIVIAVGDPAAKKEILSGITNPAIRFATLIHPSVQREVFQNITFGEGSIIAAGNIITTDISIGNHVLLNLNCTIGHDVHIGDFSSIMPGCNISGEVEIGEGTYIGTGAAIINRIRTGPYSTIGAGAAVIKDVSPHATAVGIPAKELNRKALRK